LSSAAGDVLGNTEEGIPALMLSTDSNGNIVDSIMGAGPIDGSAGVFISTPPFQCPDKCGPGIAGLITINAGNDDLEWDAFASVPGQWTNVSAVPEPSSLVLTFLGGAMLMIVMWRKQRRA